MNILFAGTPDPSGEILEYLASNSTYNIKGVITQPDKPQKRAVSYTHLTLPTMVQV